MKTKFVAILLTVAILSVSALTVLARLHTIGGAGFNSGSVIIDVTLAGYGNSELSFDAFITGTDLQATCVNKGGNIAPGQELVSIFQTVSNQTVEADENGNATVNTTIDVAGQVDARDAGCPNGKWSVNGLTGLIEVELHFFAGNDAIFEIYSCEIDDPTAFISCDLVAEGNL